MSEHEDKSEETIRRYGLTSNGRVEMLNDSEPDENALFARFSDYNLLRLEVALLKATLKSETSLKEEAQRQSKATSAALLPWLQKYRELIGSAAVQELADALAAGRL